MLRYKIRSAELIKGGEGRAAISNRGAVVRGSAQYLLESGKKKKRSGEGGTRRRPLNCRDSRKKSDKPKTPPCSLPPPCKEPCRKKKGQTGRPSGKKKKRKRKKSRFLFFPSPPPPKKSRQPYNDYNVYFGSNFNVQYF